jgi:hypothetical protein
METFLQESNRLRLLLVADVSMASVTALSESLVPLPPQFDGIVVIGPFGLGRFKTPEETAMALGDMASTVAQLENIVCRVLYLPTESEPDRTLREQLHLTPNSVNIHGRCVNIVNRVQITGFSERNIQSVCNRTTRADDEIEEPETLEVMSGVSKNAIESLLFGGEEKRFVNIEAFDEDEDTSGTSTAVDKDLGIFTLHYHYSHTLNNVLFHMNDKIQAAQIKLCIIASSNDQEISRLPTKVGDMTIAPVRSLERGYFTSLELIKDDGKWNVGRIDIHNLH